MTIFLMTTNFDIAWK